MLYLIGLGLNDENDMTLKAISLLKQCDKIYAEFYTNIWQGSIENISRMVNKNIEVLERESVESELLIKEAKDNTIALLVPGDPLSATTHFELIALARQNNIKCEIVHAPSIYTAIAETGLQLYKFGRSTTIPRFQEGYEPRSPYDVVESNKKLGYHTLILLDIGMTVTEGMKNLLKLNGNMKDEKVIVCTQLGSKSRKIIYNTIDNIIMMNISDVPAVIIILGRINFKEEEYLNSIGA